MKLLQEVIVDIIAIRILSIYIRSHELEKAFARSNAHDWTLIGPSHDVIRLPLPSNTSLDFPFPLSFFSFQYRSHSLKRCIYIAFFLSVAE